MENKYDVVIIGAGPAGIFTAIELTRKKPQVHVLIIDKGHTIDKRACPARDQGKCINCDPCAITSGWSGAGAFSDGKLSLSPDVGGRIMDYMSREEAQAGINYADKIYLEFGAQEMVYGLDEKKVDDIAYEASKYSIQLIPCPVRHLGTERAFNVLRGMYRYLINETNTSFMEATRVEEILTLEDRVQGVLVKPKGQEPFEMLADFVVAAPGRGGAEWLARQTQTLNIKTDNNEVDIGVRVEVPNSVMDHLTRDLYEAKLVYYSDTFDNRVRSFCVNPGGVVSEEHYERKLAVVNGHSYADENLKTKNTNFALLVSTRFTEPFNEPIAYGEYIARLANMLTGGGVMVQRLGDVLKGRRTDYDRLKKSTTIPTLKTAVPGDLSYVLPARYLTSIIETLKAFDHIAPGLYARNTLLYGAEVKFYSSKVRVSENFETNVANLYTIGDGAGITRGLMQASVTGIVVARDISSRI
ncbi:NAD(P)/FAD-dependent oxidoreductase [Dehalobacterium formicoaceticum]|uniref:NAD(P)/FAD-dependent oxidoreductase n=1 Tax=Dehalobacterium formicoaceticum TaxID=51515 RepID=UPI000B7E8BCE|nr:NAD(P)/FAD-dependent oxidoreductase [Dehalobacterium formicoaceticum]